MTRCDVNIGYVVTSSVKLHQEAPILFDLGGTGGVGELGGVSFIVGPGNMGNGRRNGLTGLTGVYDVELQVNFQLNLYLIDHHCQQVLILMDMKYKIMKVCVHRKNLCFSFF